MEKTVRLSQLPRQGCHTAQQRDREHGGRALRGFCRGHGQLRRAGPARAASSHPASRGAWGCAAAWCPALGRPRAPVLSQGRGFCTIFQQVFLRRDKPPTSLRFTASTEPQSSEASITQPQSSEASITQTRVPSLRNHAPDPSVTAPHWLSIQTSLTLWDTSYKIFSHLPLHCGRNGFFVSRHRGSPVFTK